MEDDKKGKSDECVNVVVRCRPLNRKEKEENRSHIVTIDVEARQVAIKNPAAPDDDPKSFTFDGAYDENTQQRNFYEECCFSMIESVLEGFNGTIFAYGQTGCGKSFTMQGPNSTPELRGVIPNSFTHIFDTVRASTDVEYLIRCSYLEIYNEEIKDLLGGHNKKDNAKCELKEDPQRGVFVKGLTDVVVETEEQMSAMLEKGLSYRTTSATLMNAESSRSHSIFTIVVEMSSVDKDTGKELLRAGKLNLVDLAGSERQKKTGATGDLLKEGAKINLSLSALGNVISALSEGKGKHIPYRDSKLTRLLQDSLGGNTKTLMVAAISPADYNFDETMSTLRYANRAKNIKNKPKINEDPKDTMIREFKAEIERLRKLLEEQASLVAAGGGLSAEMVGNLQREASSSSIHAAGVSQRGEITSFASDDGSAQGQGQGGRARKRINRARQEAEDYIEEGDAEEGDGDDDEGGDGAASSSEKKARRRAAAASSASAGAGEPIVKEVVVEKERIVVEKEIVTVEVEKIPDDHIYEKQALEEYSNAVAEERDFVSAQLKLKESEIEKERRLREELNQRLAALQSKLVGHHDESTGGQALEESSDLAARREAAERSLRERRLRAKKKREEREARQQAELERVLNEKQAMEEELEELRNSAAASAGMTELQENMVEKKLNKLKKKYEKKIKTLMSELDDVHEEFQFERQKLVDDMVEQQKDAKLYEQICRTILSDKDLKRIIDKSRWSEEDEEWILPATKRRSVDASPRGNAKGKLPEISHSVSLAAVNPRGQGTGSMASASVPRLDGNVGGYGGDRDRERDRDKGGITLPSAFLPPPNGGYSSQNSARVSTDSRQRKRESASRRSAEDAESEYKGNSVYDGNGSSSGYGNGGSGSGGSYNPQAVTSAPIPMLMLPGGIGIAGERAKDSGGGDDGPREEEKKKKRKGKKKRRSKAVDDAPGQEWGFADVGGAGYNEPEYSDDEDFQQMDQDWENDYEPSGNGSGHGGGGGGGKDFQGYPAVNGASGGGKGNSKAKPKSGIPPIDSGRNKSSMLPQLI